MKTPHGKNSPQDSRESWLRSATDELRDYFKTVGYPLPENIRFSIGFPSTGRNGRRVGELWHSSTSADGFFELFIRADIAEPVQVLGVLIHELIHAVLPITEGHGKLYRDAALKLGLVGKMREAMPGSLLTVRLTDLAASLGPLPHAKLDLERGRDNKGPVDRPKKQGTRMLKASCQDAGCSYVVRVAAKPAREIGPPHCPAHGQMVVEWPEDEQLEEKPDKGATSLPPDQQAA